MDTICIYHGNCPDGFTAAWVVKQVVPGAKFHPGVYGQPLPNVDGKNVIIVDFSYELQEMNELIKRANSVLVLDHHETAEADISTLIESGQIKGVFDMSRSGAMIAWDYFFKGQTPPMVLTLVQDKDLHQGEYDETKYVMAAVLSYKYDFATWDLFMGSTDEQVRNLMVDGKAIHRRLLKDVREMIKLASYRAEIGGHLVPVLNVPYMMAPEAADLMAKNKPFAACYWDQGDRRIYSLRSTEDGVNVADIAKKYGGGGHAHASGFSVLRRDMM